MRTACQCAVTCVCVCVGDCDTLQQVGGPAGCHACNKHLQPRPNLFFLSEESQAFFHSLICVRALLINGLPRQHHYAVNSDECHMLYREVDGQELSVCVASLWRIGCPPHTLADEWG